MGSSGDENELSENDSQEIVRKLKHVRSGHKGRVTYFANKLRADEYTSTGELESALTRLRITYSKFNETQTELEIICGDQLTQICRDEFEDDYGRVESYILDKLEVLKTSKIAQSQCNPTSNLTDSSLKTSFTIKLPQIQLPIFDGNELNWLDFRGIFTELIHSNSQLNDIAKFHYLTSCVKDGKAYKFIQPFSISNENYQNAWKNISEHYNNEILIQKLHMKQLYEIKRPIEGSSSSLQQFVNEIVKHHSSLTALKVPVESWDLFLIHHLSERLDSQSKTVIIKKSSHKELLSFDKFIEILRERCRILDAQKSAQSSNTSHQPQKSDRTSKVSLDKPTRVMTVQNINCVFCNENHTLDHCSKFKDNKISPQTRFDIVKKHSLCTNCLTQGHRVFECKSSPCSLCPLKHHVLLHFGQTRSNIRISNTPVASNASNSENSNSLPASTISKNVLSSSTKQNTTNTQILLATAVVWAENSFGKRVQCRALLDSGSQANFLTRNMCKQLSLKTESVHVKISGINGDTSFVNKKVNLFIESRTSNFKSSLCCLIKPKISELLPSYPVKYDQTSISEHIQLADPWFFKPDVVDLLIGAELFSEIISAGSSTTINNIPLHYTALGYVVMGKTLIDQNPLNNVGNTSQVKAISLNICESLDEKIQKFWEIESIDDSKPQSVEEKLCEAHYVKNVIRTSTGRYSVALPIKPNIQNLGNSSLNASKQFFVMEKRIHKNPKLRQHYSEFISEYLNLNHMQEVENPQLTDCEFAKHYFMPHHAVIRESSTTTKLRVVFNASSKTTSNLSLNDCLMVGPTIQQDLYSILMRFRKHLIGITGDITKMYRQILVHEKHQDLQRIWWRDSDSTPLKCFKLRTVTYGTACAPFLAIRTLFQLADEEESTFHTASKVVKSDFYVDDVLTGSNNLENALKLKDDFVNLLHKGGFELCKIYSNNSKITSSDDSTQSILILGMNWNIITDQFHFSFLKYTITETSTKRSVLSEIAQLFDPLGLCGPIVFKAKSFMQTLWDSQLGWDDVLPSQLENVWNEFKRQLIALDKITIPRCILIPVIKSIELHGFGDASEKGYGCVLYVRVVGQNDSVFVNFVCSKSRVAPIKVQTIPRLELCASLLLAQVVKKAVCAMEIKFHKIYFWTDSEITLHRIKSTSGRFEVFVSNRITKIHEFCSPADWYYVPTSQNPSDLVSRGLMPQEFAASKIWWTGPSFLHQSPMLIPKQPVSIPSDNAEECAQLIVGNSVKTEEWVALIKHSDYSKILRIFGYVHRFLYNCRNKFRSTHMLFVKNSKCEPLKVSEIDSGLKLIIKHIQFFEYSKELQYFRHNQCVPRQSKLISLSPFLDEHGLIRVGGRLENSEIPFDHKHQLVVPYSHSFVKLLVRHEHVRLLHTGPQSLLYNLRQRWWIINGRNLCRKIVSECIICVRTRPKLLNQIMGQLPKNRVNPSRPFENIGVDFCGPFMVTQRTKSKVQIKTYIAIFICFSTKAVHMELVSDLSTAAFLAALRRFVSRRGLCSNIYSDNATNFIGAKSELQDLYRLFKSELHQNEVLKFCLELNIQWHTIPPRSPHFGGLWEAAVKSAKYHIKRVLGRLSFLFEQLHTLITQVEGCLNSRPIGIMSDDPNDFESLTPGHFLIGQPINSIPDPNLSHLFFNRLSQFQKVQSTFQTFWKRWTTEYLSMLQQRRKWCNKIDKYISKLGQFISKRFYQQLNATRSRWNETTNNSVLWFKNESSKYNGRHRFEYHKINERK